MCGPSDLRTHTISRRRVCRRVVCASSLHPSLQTVLVQDVSRLRAVLVAGVASTSQGRRLVGVRSKDLLVEWRCNPVNTRHGADAAREHSKTHNRRNTGIDKGRKNNEPRDVHPFVISNVVRTAVRPRAALPMLNA